MANLLLCFSNQSSDEVASGIWLKNTLRGQNKVIETGCFSGDEDLKRLVHEVPGTQVTVFLPGENCTTHWVVIPSKKRESLLSIPYQLETQLTVPVEQLHFVPILKFESDNQVPVWVCGKVWLEQWLERLKGLDIQAVQVLPDYALLWGDLPRDEICQLWLGDRVIMSGQINTTVPESYVETICNQEGLGEIKEIELSELNLEFLSSSKINLLQGEFKQKLSKSSSQWWEMFAVAALLVLMLTNLLLGQLKITELDEQLQTLDYKVETSFNTVMPGKRMVDPLFQMKQEYEARHAAAEPPEILQVLNQLSSQLGANKQRLVTKLSYSSEQRELKVYHRGSPIILPVDNLGFTYKQSNKKEINHVTVNW